MDGPDDTASLRRQVDAMDAVTNDLLERLEQLEAENEDLRKRLREAGVLRG